MLIMHNLRYVLKKLTFALLVQVYQCYKSIEVSKMYIRSKANVEVCIQQHFLSVRQPDGLSTRINLPP